MKKYGMKIIAVVLVLTMAVSVFVINSSAAAEVSRVTDAIGSVIDGVETSDDVKEVLGVEVGDLIDVIKDIDNADVDVDALAQSIADKGDMTPEEKAQAVAAASANASAIDVSDVKEVAEDLAVSNVELDDLEQAVAAAAEILKVKIDPVRAAEVIRLLAADGNALRTVKVGTTALTNAEEKNWIGTWSTSMVKGQINLNQSGIQLPLADVTARIRVMSSRAGDTIRLTLSNAYGTSPLNVGEITVGLANDKVNRGVELDTLVKATVNGKTAFTIPAGSVVQTDPIDIHVDACQELMVSMYMKGVNTFNTLGLINGHCYVGLGNQTECYVSAADIDLALENLSVGAYEVVPILSNIDVYDTDEDAYSVVIFGDSTTTNTTVKKLAATLKANGITNVGLLLQGIKGNEVLLDGQGTAGNLLGDSAISRFTRDVVKQPGVKKVLIKVGVNDMAHPACASKVEEYPDFDPATQAEKIIEGYKQMIAMAHAADIEVVFATRSPCKGYTRNLLGITGDDITPEAWETKIEPIRIAVNEWLTAEVQKGTFEGLVSIEDMMDPDNYGALCSEYTLDGAHFTDLGCQEFAKRAYPVLFGGEKYTAVVKPDDMDFTGTESYGGLDNDLKPLLELLQKLFNTNNSEKNKDGIDLEALAKILDIIKNGTGSDEDISLDALKDLIKGANPDADVSNDILTKVLDLINKGNKDDNKDGNSEVNLSTILGLLTGITGKDSSEFDLEKVKDLLGAIKGDPATLDKSTDIDMSALVGLLNLIKNGSDSKDFNLDSLEDLIGKVNPDNTVGSDLIDKLLGIIENGGSSNPSAPEASDEDAALDMSTLEELLNGLEVGTTDKDALQNVLDKLLGNNGSDQNDVDPPVSLEDLGSNIDIDAWIESILGSSNGDDGQQSAVDGATITRDPDPALDDYTQGTIEDVELIESVVMPEESTPLAAAVLDTTPADYISAEVVANTGDAGLTAVVTVSIAAGAAFVASLKKKKG